MSRPDVTPFYERELGSFTDEVITTARPSRENNGLWYASLDVGSRRTPADPDFTCCAKTREAAIAQCATWIRVNHASATPNSILRGYDLHFRLYKWWAEKEGAIA